MRKLLKVIGYASGALFGVFLLALLFLSLPQSGWRALSVQTGSMVPTFDPGALVFVHKVPPDSLKKGDVVTYQSLKGGETITHRIVGFQNSGSQKLFIVKGDSNTAADSPVAASQIVGKEVKSLPYAGHIVDFVQKPLGLILAIYLPAVLLIIYEIKIMTDRLTQLEIDRRRAVVRETARNIYGGGRPKARRTRSRPLGASGRGLMILGSLLCLGFISSPAFAQLTSNTATLQGTTITTKPDSNGNGGTQTNCTSNTNVNVSNSSNQTASSGDASSNNGNSGQATSGNASNSNSTSVNVNATGC